MDLQSRKISFVQEFLRLQNEEIISGLEQFLKRKKNEFSKDQLKPMSLEQYNNEINQSLEDSKNGNLISAEDLKSKIVRWT